MHHKEIVKILFLVLVKKGASFSGAQPEIPLVSGDVGSNITLPCGEDGAKRGFQSASPLVPPLSSSSLHPAFTLGSHAQGSRSRGFPMWVQDGRSLSSSHSRVLPDGSLHFPELEQSDAGLYKCIVEMDSDASGLTEDDDVDEGDRKEIRVLLKVLSTPTALNVTVHPSTVLALVMWEVVNDGGYPIISFQVKYQLSCTTDQNTKWHDVQPEHISPNVRQIDVYHLEPNSTYIFEVWANNQLGKGEVMQLKVMTQHDPTEIELAHYLLEGAEDFDTRVWVVAVSIVMGTLVVLGVGTCYVLYRECKFTSSSDSQEIIELVPNIILNPGYEVALLDHVEPDENSNDQAPVRINNNTVVQPVRV